MGVCELVELLQLVVGGLVVEAREHDVVECVTSRPEAALHLRFFVAAVWLVMSVRSQTLSSGITSALPLDDAFFLGQLWLRIFSSLGSSVTSAFPLRTGTFLVEIASRFTLGCASYVEVELDELVLVLEVVVPDELALVLEVVVLVVDRLMK